MRGMLVFGYGNPGRGDDALGPTFVERLEQAGTDAARDIECLTDMQLQVEHVIDLRGRMMLLFVDADASCPPPFRLSRIHAERDSSYTSHAMSPEALLYAYRQVYGAEAPPAYLLRIRGYGRIDLRVTPEGEIVILEANPNPNLDHEDEFAQSAAKAGLGYPRLIQRILTLALSAAR